MCQTIEPTPKTGKTPARKSTTYRVIWRDQMGREFRAYAEGCVLDNLFVPVPLARVAFSHLEHAASQHKCTTTLFRYELFQRFILTVTENVNPLRR